MDPRGISLAIRSAGRAAGVVGVTAIALWALPVRLLGKDDRNHATAHHHYKLVVMGTFGGPSSYLSDYPANTPGILNGHGTLTGLADTPTLDPYAPDFPWSDGYVAHTFLWRDGSTQDLGALPGVTSSASTWISANGLVAGVSENGQIDPLYPGMPEVRAVEWENGQIRDLGTLEGGHESAAFGINSRGQVVGASTNTVPDADSMAMGIFWLWGAGYQYQTRAFLWDRVTGMQDLGTLGTGTDAEALFVNERGQVAGVSYISSDPGACFGTATDSFIWDAGHGMQDLGSFGGSCTLATGLNDRGQVVGASLTAGDQAVRPFLWENGSFQDLGGTLGGSGLQPNALNQKGEAAGAANLPGDTTSHAVLWRHVGDFTDLGTVGDDPCSIAWAINDATQVVGISSPSDCINFDISRPFLWEKGSIADLNSLIPPNSPLMLYYAYAINDRGEISGNGGDADGNTHAFLLIPCDEGHPGLEGCDYSLVEAGASSRARVPEGQPSPLPAGRSAHDNRPARSGASLLTGRKP